jgi:hypothetical protein
MSACRAALAALVLAAACQPVPPDPAPEPPPIAAPGAIPSAALATAQPAGESRPAVGPPEQEAVEVAGRPFFCAPLQPLPRPPPYCTRSIGQVDCWVQPPLTLPPRRGVADGRESLTPAQAAQRRQCWPGIL